MHLFFTRKMMVGSKNIFFNFHPLKINLLKDFIAKKVLFQKKTPALDFESKLLKVYIYFGKGIHWRNFGNIFLWYFPFKGTVNQSIIANVTKWTFVRLPLGCNFVTLDWLVWLKIESCVMKIWDFIMDHCQDMQRVKNVATTSSKVIIHKNK